MPLGENGALSQGILNAGDQTTAQRLMAQYEGGAVHSPATLAALRAAYSIPSNPSPNQGNDASGGGYGGGYGGYGGGYGVAGRSYDVGGGKTLWDELMAQLDQKRQEIAQNLTIENQKEQLQRDLQNQKLASDEKLKQEELANAKLIAGQTNVSEYDKMLAGLKGPADPYSYLFMSRGMLPPKGYQAAQMALPQAVLDQMKSQGIDQKQLQDWLSGNGAVNQANAAANGQGNAPTFAGVLGGMNPAFASQANPNGYDAMQGQQGSLGGNVQRPAGQVPFGGWQASPFSFGGPQGVMSQGAPSMPMQGRMSPMMGSHLGAASIMPGQGAYGTPPPSNPMMGRMSPMMASHMPMGIDQQMPGMPGGAAPTGGYGAAPQTTQMGMYGGNHQGLLSFNTPQGMQQFGGGMTPHWMAYGKNGQVIGPNAPGREVEYEGGGAMRPGANDRLGIPSPVGMAGGAGSPIGYGAEPPGMNRMMPPSPIGSQGPMGGWSSSGPVGFGFGGMQPPSYLAGGLPNQGQGHPPMDLSKLDPYTRGLVDNNGRPMAPSAQQLANMPQSGLDAYKNYVDQVAGANSQDLLDLGKQLEANGAPIAGGTFK